MKSTKLLLIIPLFVLVWPGAGCKRESIDRLLQQGKLAAAERRCEKKKGEEKINCCKAIAAFYLGRGKYLEAANYYDKAGEPIKVIDTYFQGDFIPQAEGYFEKQTAASQKQCAARLGKKFFIRENYNKAIHYYNLAGDNRKVEYIQAQIPLFQLVDRIGKEIKDIKEPGIVEKMTAIKKTLTTYIYMDEYYTWPYVRKPGPYRQAAQIHEKAVKMLKDKVMPALTGALTGTTVWSKENVDALSFDHFKLESLLNLVTYLHRIAGKSGFFGKIPGEGQSVSLRLNYEEAYLKTLDHAAMLLEEISAAGSLENKEGQENKADMVIDMQIIDYLASMMDNVKIRMEDIHTRSRVAQETGNGKTTREKAGKFYRDFVDRCGRVLHLISKEEYREANDLLLSGYETAKTGLAKYGK